MFKNKNISYLILSSINLLGVKRAVYEAKGAEAITENYEIKSGDTLEVVAQNLQNKYKFNPPLNVNDFARVFSKLVEDKGSVQAEVTRKGKNPTEGAKHRATAGASQKRCYKVGGKVYLKKDLNISSDLLQETITEIGKEKAEALRKEIELTQYIREIDVQEYVSDHLKNITVIDKEGVTQILIEIDGQNITMPIDNFVNNLRLFGINENGKNERWVGVIYNDKLRYINDKFQVSSGMSYNHLLQIELTDEQKTNLITLLQAEAPSEKLKKVQEQTEAETTRAETAEAKAEALKNTETDRQNYEKSHEQERGIFSTVIDDGRGHRTEVQGDNIDAEVTAKAEELYNDLADERIAIEEAKNKLGNTAKVENLLVKEAKTALKKANDDLTELEELLAEHALYLLGQELQAQGIDLSQGSIELKQGKLF